jgi:hypothetical protein
MENIVSFLIGFGLGILTISLAYLFEKKNEKRDYIDLNFKGYANKVQTTDIKLPSPIPLRAKKVKRKRNKKKK